MRIIGKCGHNNVRREIMIIIATCDADRKLNGTPSPLLRAETVHCRCSLRSLFSIRLKSEWSEIALKLKKKHTHTHKLSQRGRQAETGKVKMMTGG